MSLNKLLCSVQRFTETLYTYPGTADNGFELYYNSGGALSGAMDINRFARFGRIGETINNSFQFFRFPLNIPQATKLYKATLTLFRVRPSDVPATVVFKIHIEDAATSPALLATNFNISSRLLLSENIDCSITVASTPVGGYTWISPDLTALIQSVVNRPDWVSGNYIGLVLKATADSVGLVMADTISTTKAILRICV